MIVYAADQPKEALRPARTADFVQTDCKKAIPSAPSSPQAPGALCQPPVGNTVRPLPCANPSLTDGASACANYSQYPGFVAPRAPLPYWTSPPRLGCRLRSAAARAVSAQPK